MNNKIPTISLSILAVTAFSLVAISTASADTVQGDSFANRFAQRFNLNSNEVQEFMNENRPEHSRRYKDDKAGKFQRYVDDGTITEEQKDMIVAKMQELRENTANYAELSDEERSSLKDSHHSELVSWAQSNNIDTSIFDMSKMHDGSGDCLMGTGMRMHNK